MGYRYGRSIWEIGHKWDIDGVVDMEYGLSIWDTNIEMVVYHIDMVILNIDMGYGIMGDDSIDMVISHIDMGYLVTVIGRENTSLTCPCMHDARRLLHAVAAQVEFESKF